MGLDIYVGSFTRYYGGNWETIVARAAREQGIPFKVIRRAPPAQDAVTDQKIVGETVENWRRLLEAGLAPHLPDGLKWDEREEAEYFTHKPAWDNYWSLILLAAHTAYPEFDQPIRATEEPGKDPAYQHLRSLEFRCRFSQLFDVEIWLPCPFAFTFKTASLPGPETRFGSSVTLLEQLRLLNDETYKGTEEELVKWGRNCPEHLAEFEKSAQYALALFLQLAKLSVEHRLPMKLDY